MTYMPFPKPKRNLVIAKRWVYLCANQLTIKRITRNTYICSKHFPVGSILNLKANPNLEPFNARKQSKEKAIGQESGHVRVRRVLQRVENEHTLPEIPSEQCYGAIRNPI